MVSQKQKFSTGSLVFFFLLVAIFSLPCHAGYIPLDVVSGDFTYIGPPNSKWEPGPNEVSIHTSIPPAGPGTPGGATWSIMPIGTQSVGADSHGGAGSLSSSALSLITGTGSGSELTIYNDALNAWASVSGFTNLGQVSDNGAPIGTIDPGGIGTNTLFGDIRIGAYTFDGANGTLAHAYQPGTSPFFSSSLGGDLHFDVAETWIDDPTGSAGSGFDLFTVALHEFGHSLGLGHTDINGSVMYQFYSGTNRTLHADDIAGIQALYGSNTAVPLPSGVLLLGSGLIGLITISRRKKDKP